jgi:hypothetical protein
MPCKRLGTKDENDAGAGPGEGAADEPADTARTQNRVSHAAIVRLFWVGTGS